MGTTENSIIQLKEDLTRKPGDKVIFANVRKLSNDGVTGNTVLEGNEEELDSRSMAVTVNPLRNAVVVTDWDEQKSAIDLMNAGRGALKLWAMEKMRDGIINALKSINGTAYASAAEATKDAWLVDNADRVLFGALRSNGSSLDHSTSLANIEMCIRDRYHSSSPFTRTGLIAGLAFCAMRLANETTAGVSLSLVLSMLANDVEWSKDEPLDLKAPNNTRSALSLSVSYTHLDVYKRQLPYKAITDLSGLSVTSA